MNLKETIKIWVLALFASFMLFTAYAVFIAGPINMVAKTIAQMICASIPNCDPSKIKP